MRLFASVFGIIFVAELPDKTALASLILATRHKPLPVFLGASLALTVQSVVAVTVGRLLSGLSPRGVHVGAGVVFLAAAVLMWIRRPEAKAEKDGSPAKAAFLRTTATSFGVVFVAEWGDLTQFATAALAARYRAILTVFLAATAALWAVAALAVFVGDRAGKLFDPSLTQKIAAVLFASVGISLILGWL